MLSRRQLLFSSAIAPFLLAASDRPLTPIKPPRLRAGDGVGIFSPAGATFERQHLDIVIDAVKGLGLQPVLGQHVLARYGGLAGPDADRAADLNALFADDRVKLLLPLRGGWGSSRILPALDYELMRRHPKILVGFSDITALLLGIHARTGLVTFHGPNGFSSWRTQQVDWFRRVLFQGEAVKFENPSAPGDSDRLMATENRIQTITPGRARGPLIGGNLSVLCGIVGSPYFPSCDGAILCVEDVGEAPYRLDRLLMQLQLAGILDKLAGFIFGQCPGCTPGEGYGALTLDEILRDRIAPLGIPAFSGAYLGHVENLMTLPIGLPVEIDAARGTIAASEPAVR
ncbi:MAG: LD-carboxypeptidase [Cyanobacteria bacterium J06641_5]